MSMPGVRQLEKNTWKDLAIPFIDYDMHVAIHLLLW